MVRDPHPSQKQTRKNPIPARWPPAAFKPRFYKGSAALLKDAHIPDPTAPPGSCALYAHSSRGTHTPSNNGLLLWPPGSRRPCGLAASQLRSLTLAPGHTGTRTASSPFTVPDRKHICRVLNRFKTCLQISQLARLARGRNRAPCINIPPPPKQACFTSHPALGAWLF